jgi:alpha-mannosidase
VADGRAPARSPGLLKVAPRLLENDLLRVRFDGAGRITSIFDKEFRREVLVRGARANRFQLYEDTPGHYEAWDIAPSYTEHELAVGPGRLRVDERGPIRASLRLEQPIGDSLLVQRISLLAGSRAIRFETRVRWVERQRLLKVAFPVNIRAAEATYDIAFGNMKRPAHRNDSYAAARFEVPAHQWMDLSQPDYGVSLMNDCKYGHEANGRLMRLTLLKGPTKPDPESDKETHEFIYVLYPHAGSWREARTNEAAMELNSPLVARPVAKAPARAAHSFLRCDAPGLALEAVKLAEDGRGLIVRLVERLGGRTAGRIALDRPIRRAWTCNLMEENEGRLAVEDGSVALAAGPYEILTLRLAF